MQEPLLMGKNVRFLFVLSLALINSSQAIILYLFNQT